MIHPPKTFFLSSWTFWVHNDISNTEVNSKQGSDQWVWRYTVKAPNFGPHENFGPLFHKDMLSLKRVLQKKENKSSRKTLDLQIRLRSFFVHDSSTEATELVRKSPKFPWGPKLETFTVTILRKRTEYFQFSQYYFCSLQVIRVYFDLANAGTYLKQRKNQQFMRYLWVWGRESQCFLINTITFPNFMSK